MSKLNSFVKQEAESAELVQERTEMPTQHNDHVCSYEIDENVFAEGEDERIVNKRARQSLSRLSLPPQAQKASPHEENQISKKYKSDRQTPKVPLKPSSIVVTPIRTESPIRACNSDGGEANDMLIQTDLNKPTTSTQNEPAFDNELHESPINNKSQRKSTNENRISSRLRRRVLVESSSESDEEVPLKKASRHASPVKNKSLPSRSVLRESGDKIEKQLSNIQNILKNQSRVQPQSTSKKKKPAKLLNVSISDSSSPDGSQINVKKLSQTACNTVLSSTDSADDLDFNESVNTVSKNKHSSAVKNKDKDKVTPPQPPSTSAKNLPGKFFLPFPSIMRH